MSILKGLEPKKVMENFEALSQIPRESKNEKEVSDWLVEFAKSKNLEVIQDEALNVIIKVPATEGYENAPTTIIQGHMDMVCEKNQDVEHDFAKDPIKLQVDGEWIKATGTTLGADNGIAVAFALAVLDSDLPHPKLEILITADEEMGMTGAEALDGSMLEGKVLLNIDTEEEGEFYVSCAGGCRAQIELPVTFEEKEVEGYKVSIRGLNGGHSGADIHMQLANSNVLLARTLNEIAKKDKFRFGSLSGGAKENAIPREADALIVLNSLKEEELVEITTRVNRVFRDEFRVSDSEVKIVVEKAKLSKVMDENSSEKLLSLIVALPNGINTMSLDIEGLVESSLNIGVVTQEEDRVVIKSAVRSSVESRKFEILEKLETISKLVGASYLDKLHYPAWQYSSDSRVRDLCEEVYERVEGKKPGIKAIHAGLECGLLSQKLPGVDMISFGPDIRGAHTPEERVRIKSVENVWNIFVEVLKSLKDY